MLRSPGKIVASGAGYSPDEAIAVAITRAEEALAAGGNTIGGKPA